MTQKDISGYIVDRMEIVAIEYKKWRNGIIDAIKARLIKYPGHKIVSIYVFMQNIETGAFPTYAKHFEFGVDSRTADMWMLIERFIKNLPMSSLHVLVEIPVQEMKNFFDGYTAPGVLLIDMEEFKYNISTMAILTDELGLQSFHVTEHGPDIDDLFPFMKVFCKMINSN